MANVENYGWAYVHPTLGQAQARGVDQSIQFLSGAVDSNGIGSASGSADLTFDYANNQLDLTGNMTASGHVSASAFYGDGSNLEGVDSFPYTGDAVITGSLTVTQAITASNYVIENTIEINSNGSSQFGNTDDDTHEFTGSVSFGVSGSPAPDFKYDVAKSQVRLPAVRVPYRSEASTAFSASTQDYIIGVASNTSTAVLIELPSAADAGSGSLIVIKDEATGNRAAPNEITVSASSGQTVEDTTYVTIAGTMVSKTFYSNGISKWFVI